MAGIFFQLAADIGHVDAEDLVVPARGGAPKLAQKIVVRQNFPGVAPQKRDDQPVKIFRARADGVPPAELLAIQLLGREGHDRVRAGRGEAPARAGGSG